MTLNSLYLNKAALKTLVFIFIIFSWFFGKFRVPENPKITYEKAQTGTWHIWHFFQICNFSGKFRYRQTFRVVQKISASYLKTFSKPANILLVSILILLVFQKTKITKFSKWIFEML